MKSNGKEVCPTEQSRKKNLDIRVAAQENGVYLWEIAAKLGKSEPTFQRWLRQELSDEWKAKAFAAIEEIKQERG